MFENFSICSRVQTWNCNHKLTSQGSLSVQRPKWRSESWFACATWKRTNIAFVWFVASFFENGKRNAYNNTALRWVESMKKKPTTWICDRHLVSTTTKNPKKTNCTKSLIAKWCSQGICLNSRCSFVLAVLQLMQVCVNIITHWAYVIGERRKQRPHKQTSRIGKATKPNWTHTRNWHTTWTKK